MKTINCSKTIWILATNALDEGIVQFCRNNDEIFDESDKSKRELLLDGLTEVMKERFKGNFKVRYDF